MAQTVSILAVTCDAEEWKALETMGAKENWLLFWAHNATRAYDLVRRYRIQIVICDRDVDGEDWRTIIAGFADVHPPVCTLLASEVADEYLWREVVKHKGFEVLAKPFDPAKVIRTVRYACWVLPNLSNNSLAHRVKY